MKFSFTAIVFAAQSVCAVEAFTPPRATFIRSKPMEIRERLHSFKNKFQAKKGENEGKNKCCGGCPGCPFAQGKSISNEQEFNKLGLKETKTEAVKLNPKYQEAVGEGLPLFHLAAPNFRPLVTAGTALFLAMSILFPFEAQAQGSTSTTVSQSATSIDIDLRGIPELTRKVVLNRDALTQYLIKSAKSFEPILSLLSESNTVKVNPPSDIKGAINSLAGGEAQVIVNGAVVDIRVESVPGVVIVRVLNPNLPRLPFLKDGTAALKFVDEIVDVAPVGFERAAEEVQSVQRFLTWGATTEAPIRFQGTWLDSFLSQNVLFQGAAVSLGILGDLTNAEVAAGLAGTGIAGLYSVTYNYHVSLQEEAKRAADEKKAKALAKKKAKANGAVALSDTASDALAEK